MSELTRRVIEWASNHNATDRQRVRDAKPIMDDLLKCIRNLQSDRESTDRLMLQNAELKKENERMRTELSGYIDVEEWVRNLMKEREQAEGEK